MTLAAAIDRYLPQKLMLWLTINDKVVLYKVLLVELSITTLRKVYG